MLGVWFLRFLSVGSTLYVVTRPMSRFCRLASSSAACFSFAWNLAARFTQSCCRGQSVGISSSLSDVDISSSLYWFIAEIVHHCISRSLSPSAPAVYEVRGSGPVVGVIWKENCCPCSPGRFADTSFLVTSPSIHPSSVHSLIMDPSVSWRSRSSLGWSFVFLIG